MVTTHFMDEAEYCDRVALIYRGQCIAIDAPEALQAAVRSAALPASHPGGRLHRPRRGRARRGMSGFGPRAGAGGACAR